MTHLVTCISAYEMWVKLYLFLNSSESKFRSTVTKEFSCKYEGGGVAIFVSKLQELSVYLRIFAPKGPKAVRVNYTSVNQRNRLQGEVELKNSSNDSVKGYRHTKGSNVNAFIISAVMLSESVGYQSWYIDSGASEHMCAQRKLFSEFNELGHEK
ncbi:hypothetical protein PR048_022617 [Dryococelus australis]|uniref:Retrovirus-related Pol polyprotein from transposon TNT 1-94-like beta-barrel domain-containing protein n=1 Tax=Dryococelus australis TaxID=614101 RepID=A0ABQ9H1J5_9NEOP|nr:hypothetical protein PR048_022617 [Dryococelus australis]